MSKLGQKPLKSAWNTKWPDFTLVFETGEEFKCHKMMLARSSLYFEAMLANDCKKAKNNQMLVKELSPETVATFLVPIR